MEDLEDILPPRVPLHAAKDSSEIKRSEVYCSKIIHQRLNHQIRFRRSAFYLKLVRHSHPDVTVPNDRGEYPRPLSSPFPCFQCHRKFSGPPIGIPIEMLDGQVEEWGNFCKGPCVMTYMRKNMRDSNLAMRIADFFEYMQDYHGFRGTEIGFAPHFTEHENYGGDLTDAQFDDIIGNPQLTTHILMKPYIPTDAVIEWQYSGNLTDTAAVNITSYPVAKVAAEPILQRDALDVGLPAQESGFQNNAPKTLKPSEELLASVMKTRPPNTDHHHRWDATHLKQPSLEAIEERLASLPELPKTTGLYELYLQRKGGLEGPLSDEEKDSAAAPTASSTRTRKKTQSSKSQPIEPETATPAPFANLLTSATSSNKKRKVVAEKSK